MIAYRAWKLRDDGYLESLFYDQPWYPGITMAACRSNHTAIGERWPARGVHAAPNPDCRCGLWCLPSRNALEDYVRRDRRNGPWSWAFMYRVMGRIETYGRHVEHETGIRCERAQITGLDLSSGLPNHVKAIAMRYDVPVYGHD